MSFTFASIFEAPPCAKPKHKLYKVNHCSGLLLLRTPSSIPDNALAANSMWPQTWDDGSNLAAVAAAAAGCTTPAGAVWHCISYGGVRLMLCSRYCTKNMGRMVKQFKQIELSYSISKCVN